MPDRDIYDRHVERGWQTAARRVYQGDWELAVPSLLGSLKRVVKRDGCRGIDRIAAIVVTAVCSPDLTGRRRAAEPALARVERDNLSTPTDIATAAARRIIADPGQFMPIPLDPSAKEQSLAIATAAILVEVAMTKISPPCLTGEILEKDGVPSGVVIAHRQRARGLLAEAPDLLKLARAVLQQPDGKPIKLPRVRIAKPPQEVLIERPISA